MRDKDVIVIRGLPGCGKSAFANAVGGPPGRPQFNGLVDAVLVSEDDFFVLNGVLYEFVPERRYTAMGDMIDRAIVAMRQGIPRVIVHTCALKIEELSGIYRAAEELGYKVYSLVLENRHGGKSVHNVKPEDYEWMRKHMEVRLDAAD